MNRLIGLLYCLIFALGLWVESPSTSRLIELSLGGVTGFCLIALVHWKRLKEKPLIQYGICFAMPLCIAVVENQSKYSVNEFFHLLYFVVLLNLYLLKNEQLFLWSGALSGGALLWKYAYIYSISPELLKVPQLTGSIGLFLLVAIILWLGIRLNREQLSMQRLNQTLEERQALLQATNERLENLMDEMEALTVYRERQKMAREIHDTVGHELTALTMKLEMSKYFIEREPNKGAELLAESIDDSRRALRLTRQVVEAMTNIRRSAEDIAQLVSRFHVEGGLKIMLSGQETMSMLDTEQSHAVYRAVQEGITNCLKHSDANTLNISMKDDGNYFSLEIRDNGQNYNTKATDTGHFGLKGMKARVEEASGSFECGFDHGFWIKAVFLMKEEHS